MSRKWALGRRRDTVDDTIHIENESANEWWVEREELATPIDRRWRRPAAGGQYPFRRASDRTGTVDAARHDARRISPLFAPPDAADAHDPVDAWDRDSLFRRRERATSAAHRTTDTTGPTADTTLDATTPVPATTPWDLLGLTSDATWDQVVARHRELAKSHHPDRHGSADEQARRAAESQMAAINAAFNDLGRIYRLTDER